MQAAGWPAIAEPVNGACKRVFAAPGQKAGLAPIYIRRSTRKSAPTARGVRFRAGTVTLGARGDSHYEYLLKHYIANGKRDKEWLRAYMAAMDGLRNWLVAETMPAAEGGLLFVGEMSIAEIGGAFSALRALGKIGAPPLRPKMDHLVCFLPGVLALGHMHGIETGAILSMVLATTASAGPPRAAGSGYRALRVAPATGRPQRVRAQVSGSGGTSCPTCSSRSACCTRATSCTGRRPRALRQRLPFLTPTLPSSCAPPALSTRAWNGDEQLLCGRNVRRAACRRTLATATSTSSPWTRAICCAPRRWSRSS